MTYGALLKLFTEMEVEASSSKKDKAGIAAAEKQQRACRMQALGREFNSVHKKNSCNS